MKTKLYSLILLAVLFLVSCTPNNPQPNPTSSNNSVTASWQGNIDGNSFSYIGIYNVFNTLVSSTSNYMNNPGRSEGTYASVNLDKGVVPGTNGNTITMILYFPMNVNIVGTHILNNSNNNGYYLNILSNNGTSSGWMASSLYANSNITLNITEFPTNIGGLIKGNLSGVAGIQPNPNIPNTPAPKAVSISFEAIRKG